MKKELLLVFCLVLLLNTVSAQSDAECDADSRCLFYSSWNTATGYSDEAIDDGTKWITGYHDEPLQRPYVSAGGPGEQNFLNLVTAGGGGWGNIYYFNYHLPNIYNDPDNLYFRFYFRVHDDWIDDGSTHWFQGDLGSGHYINFDITPTSELPDIVGNTDFVLELEKYGTGMFQANVPLNKERWYCYELHVQEVDDNLERWYVRLDEEDITDKYYGISGNIWSYWLDDWYASGDGFANSEHTGIRMHTYDQDTINNGWDVAAVEIRDDHWVGCFDEQPCADNDTRSCSTGLDGICSTGEETCSNTEWGSCGQTVFPETEICDDGLDNDCDGGTDCSDSGCFSLPACQSNAVLEEDFADGDFSGWTVVDEGTIAAPSSWNVVSGELVQSSNIYGPDSDDVAPYEVHKPGSFLYYNNGMGWTDYSFSSRVRSTDNDGIGVMFRYSGPDNYYRFMMDSQRNYRRLSKIVDGVESIIAEDLSNGYASGQWYALDISANGSNIAVSLNGSQIFNETDSSLSAGTVALYVWGVDGAYFDDILVSSSSPCVPVQEICDDSMDNDCDGFVDCDDVLNCPASLPECQQQCTEQWSCTSWSSCSNGTQTRSCSDPNPATTNCPALPKPAETQSCTVDAGLLFESNWNYATGSSTQAWNDGSIWRSANDGSDLLQDFYVSPGGPGGNNFMNMVTVSDCGWGCGSYYNWSIIGENNGDIFGDPEDLYIRFYFKLHQEWVDERNEPLPMTHWFQGVSDNDRADVQHFLNFEGPPGDFPELDADWSINIENYGNGKFIAITEMETERWYCYEIHIDEVDENLERWFIRLDGVDITDKYFCGAGPCGWGNWLNDLYDSGWGFTNDYTGNLWISTYDQESLNEGWDVTGILVRTDTWPGCLGPEAIVDAQECEISISEFSAVGSAVNNCLANNLEYQYEAGMAVRNWVTSLTPNMNHNVKIENLTAGTEQDLSLNSDSEGKLQFSS
ncbi:MAG: family 16 glycoside hydrolase [Candidatus Diapherotrites archaeon]